MCFGRKPQARHKLQVSPNYTRLDHRQGQRVCVKGLSGLNQALSVHFSSSRGHLAEFRFTGYFTLRCMPLHLSPCFGFHYMETVENSEYPTVSYVNSLPMSFEFLKKLYTDKAVL